MLQQKTWHTLAFTLIELIVAITIFAMIMISVMSIFILSSQMSSKIELTRVMQENIKIWFEDIAESVRKNDITSLRDIWDACWSFVSWTGTKLCIGDSDNGSTYTEYYIAQKLWWSWNAVTNLDECKDIDETDDTICRLIKSESGIKTPLSNNLVAYENIEFLVENEKVPRVTIYATVRPAYKKWISPGLIESSRMYIQTTISERTIITK